MGKFPPFGHERVRKDDDIAPYRGSRAAERRSYRDQRPSHVQRSPAGLRPGRQAQDRHGVSIVRDLAAHDRVPERQPSVAGIERRAIERKVNDALDLVDLRTMGLHSATQLSGGQQQRVALARCIVSGSPVILMDEQQPGRQPADRHADRDPKSSAPARADDLVREGDVDRRHHLPAERRKGAAEGPAEGNLREPEDPVCRRVPGPGQYIVDRFERTTAGDACCIRLGAPVLPVPAAIPDKGASVHTAGEMARRA